MFASMLDNIMGTRPRYHSEVPDLGVWTNAVKTVLEQQSVRISTDRDCETIGDPPIPHCARVVQDEDGLAIMIPVFDNDDVLQVAEAILHEAAHIVLHLSEGASFSSAKAEKECYTLQMKWVRDLLPTKADEFDQHCQEILDSLEWD